MSKNSKNKFRMSIRTFYIGTQVFDNKEHFMWHKKKTKICPINSDMFIHKFVFFYIGHKKLSFLLKICVQT
jgi:hypothetical protein